MKECGKRIEILMKEKEITILELAKQTGISKSAVQRITSGNLSIIDKFKCNIERIAEELDTSPIRLFGWDQKYYYSNDENFRQLQKAIRTMDKLREECEEAYYLFGFDILKLTGEEIIERVRALEKLREELKEHEVE